MLVRAGTALAIFARILIVFSQTGYDYIGGVALRYPDGCPTGTISGDITYEQNCCPENQYFPPSNADYCCGNTTDCLSEVTTHVKCADPSWEYCPSPNNAVIGFCCLAGWVCYEELPNNGEGGGVACGPPGYQLESYQTAVPTAILANEGPGATTSTSISLSSVVSTTTTASTTPSTSATTSAQSNSSGAASAAPTAASASSNSSTTSTTSSTLKIGLGVGLGVGLPMVLLLGALVGFLIWRSCHRSQPDSAAEPFGLTHGIEAKPSAFSDHAQYTDTMELGRPYTDHVRASELDTEEPRRELGGEPRSEMLA